jgi:hypothetical protein
MTFVQPSPGIYISEIKWRILQTIRGKGVQIGIVPKSHYFDSWCRKICPHCVANSPIRWPTAERTLFAHPSWRPTKLEQSFIMLTIFYVSLLNSSAGGPLPVWVAYFFLFAYYFFALVYIFWHFIFTSLLVL